MIKVPQYQNLGTFIQWELGGRTQMDTLVGCFCYLWERDIFLSDSKESTLL
jgi:hypothetical protein